MLLFALTTVSVNETHSITWLALKHTGETIIYYTLEFCMEGKNKFFLHETLSNMCILLFTHNQGKKYRDFSAMPPQYKSRLHTHGNPMLGSLLGDRSTGAALSAGGPAAAAAGWDSGARRQAGESSEEVGLQWGGGGAAVGWCCSGVGVCEEVGQ